jgi:restriction endonuclease S subunit
MNVIKRVSLGELLTLERRPVQITAEKEYAEIGIYCFGRGIFHKTPRTGLEVGDKNLYLIKEGDFILQVTFAWEGAVALASSRDEGMYGSTRFPTFRVDETQCHPSYLLNYLKTQEGIIQLGNISPGSAGRNRVLSLKRLPEVSVPLPSLKEQRRVVARIEELSFKIGEAKALRLESFREAEAFFINTSRKLFNPSNGSVWRNLSVEECCETIIDYRGRTPPISETGIPHITSANIKNGRIDWNTNKFVSEETYQAFMTRGIPQQGDVIFTMEAPLATPQLYLMRGNFP